MPFQFGILSLLSLTTVAAVVLALLRPLDLPPLLHAILGGYAILTLGFIVLRGSFLWRKFRRLQLANRRELEAWIRQRRDQCQASPDSTDDSPTTNPEDADI